MFSNLQLGGASGASAPTPSPAVPMAADLTSASQQTTPAAMIAALGQTAPAPGPMDGNRTAHLNILAGPGGPMGGPAPMNGGQMWQQQGPMGMQMGPGMGMQMGAGQMMGPGAMGGPMMGQGMMGQPSQTGAMGGPMMGQGMM